MKFRLLILTTLTLLVGGFLMAIVFVSDRIHEREAHVELAADLERSTIALTEIAALRSTTLAGALHVTAEEPRLKAVVATDEIEHATVLDVASELRRTMHADLFLMVDGGGRLTADTLAPDEYGARLDGVPLVAQALHDGAAEAVWVSGERAFQVAGRRMAFGDEVVGAVVAGRAIDDEVVASIARQSGAVVLVTLDGKPIATAGAERATLDALAAASTSEGEGAQQLSLPDGRWVARRDTLPGYAGDHRLEYVVARSLDGALAASRELSRRFHQLAGVAFALAIVLALALARTLSRPLDRLVAFTRSIGAGALETRAPMGGPREVRTLGAAMNAMAAELAGSRAQLERVNQSLERTVDERTLDLRQTNREITEMLDHLDDAVFIVGRSLKVEPRCSHACAQLFGRERVEGVDIRELLFSQLRLRIDAEALGVHAFVFENSFGESELQWELNQHLLLREVVFQHAVAPFERTFSIRYAPLFDDAGEISRVMLVVTDVTELLALRKSAEFEQRRSGARVEALLAFSRCTRREALQFVDESVARMMRVLEGVDHWIESRERSVLVAVMRELHTLKGNARALRLKEISTRAHALEGAVQQMLLPGAETSPSEDLAVLLDELRPALLALEDQLAIHATVADELLRRQSDRPRVDISRMQAWLGALATEATGRAHERITTMASLLGAEAAEEIGGVGRMLGQQRAMIEEVGEQLGKQVRLDIESGSELFVTPPVAACMRDAFVHAIRNAIDHGIEPPNDRIRAGKPSTGVVSLRWELRREHWFLRISDDGRGIDPTAIAKLARKHGLLTSDEAPTPDRIHELLFEPSFTSKVLADDISGRGVGLDAIRTGLRACGIQVELTSELGVGTTLELRVPIAAVRFEERGGVPMPTDAQVLAAA